MKFWRKAILGSAVLLLILGPAGMALGASVSGRSSTVLEWFDTAQEKTAVPFHQYLLFNVHEIAPGLSFHSYGRLSDDLASRVDVDSRLYYAFLEKRGLLLPNLDARLGRQFISTAAGASVMDGLHLQYNDLGPAILKIFGGGDVRYHESYSAEDLIWGAEVSAKIGLDLDLGLSYLQKWDGGDLAHELIGFEANYVWRRMLNIYSETQYSWITKDVAYFNLGANYYRNPKWSLRTEYLYSLPLFPSTSIYSVFAADKYQELMAELVYYVDPGLRLLGRYVREFHESFSDANLFEFGVEKLRTDRFSGYVLGTWRDDKDGQDLKGIKVRAAWLFNRYVDAGVGAHIDVLERRLNTHDLFEEKSETTARRYWVDSTVYFSPTVNLQGKVERIESEFWNYYYQGRVRLNILF